MYKKIGNLWRFKYHSFHTFIMETRRVPPDISDRVIFYQGITAYYDIVHDIFLMISNKKVVSRQTFRQIRLYLSHHMK